MVAATTDGQREFLQSLGLEDAIEGVVSLESLKRREGANFNWPNTLPRLPDAKVDVEVFKAAVREYQDKVMKPFGSAIGRILRSADNPRGAPDIVFERAGQDALGVSTSLVKPFTGRVVFSEDLQGRRFTFYAPQVWTRQRKIIMPTAAILGTHLCNAYEVARDERHDRRRAFGGDRAVGDSLGGPSRSAPVHVGEPARGGDLFGQPRASGLGSAQPRRTL